MKKLLAILLFLIPSLVFSECRTWGDGTSTNNGFPVESCDGTNSNEKEFFPSQDKLNIVKNNNHSSYRFHYYANNTAHTKIKDSKVVNGIILDSIERRGNTFMVASNAVNLKTNKYLYAFNWLSINCDTNEVKDFGNLTNNGNGQKNPPEKMSGKNYNLLHGYFCGTNYNNKIYYNYLVNYQNKDSGNNDVTYWSYTEDEVFIDGNFRNLNWIKPTYNGSGNIDIIGHTLEGKMKIDCNKESVISNGQEHLASTRGSVSFYIVKRVCDPTVAFFKGNSNATRHAKKNTAPIDLSNYKSICREIGFKEKTEKFGSCVLKLKEKAVREQNQTNIQTKTTRIQQQRVSDAAKLEATTKANAHFAKIQAQNSAIQRQYQAELAAYNKNLEEARKQAADEKRRDRGMKLLELGLGIASGKYEGRGSNSAYSSRPLPTPPSINPYSRYRINFNDNSYMDCDYNSRTRNADCF